MSPGPVPVSSPPPGQGPTSSRSSQCVPLPRKPTGQEPQDQEPSGKLLHWAPGKQGLDKQPSVWEEAERGQHRTAPPAPRRRTQALPASGGAHCRETELLGGAGASGGVATSRIDPQVVKCRGCREPGRLSSHKTFPSLRASPCLCENTDKLGDQSSYGRAHRAELSSLFFCCSALGPTSSASGAAPDAHLWGSSACCTSDAPSRPPRSPCPRAAARGCCRRASAPGSRRHR